MTRRTLVVAGVVVILGAVAINVFGGHGEEGHAGNKQEETVANNDGGNTGKSKNKKNNDACVEMVVKGDFSCYAGNYVYEQNAHIEATTLDKDGVFIEGIGVASEPKNFLNEGKPTTIQKRDDGVIELTYQYDWPEESGVGLGVHDFKYYFIPEGVEYKHDEHDFKTGGTVKKDTNKNKVRIVDTVCDNCEVLPIYYSEP